MRRAVTIISLCIVFPVLAFFSLPWLLIRPAETAPSDVILYFAYGDKPATNQYVAELYRQGLAKKIVCLSGQITWNTYPADFVREQLLQLGVPAADVTTLHLPRLECGADLAMILLNSLQQQGWKRVLVVANPITSRTTRRVLSPRFEQSQISLFITYSPAERAELSGQWWRKHTQTQMVVQQGIETMVDLLYPHCW